MSLLQLEQRKLILFDLDGTLVDTASDMYHSMNLSLEQLGWAAVTEVQVRQWVGQGTGKLCDAVLQFLFGQIEPEKHQQLLKNIWKFMSRSCVFIAVYLMVYRLFRHV